MTLYYPDNKDEFIGSLPKIGAVLGLDVGTKRIGVGASDLMRVVATPVTVLKRDKFQNVVHKLDRLISEYQAVGLVVGYPYEMSGEEGVSCQRVRHFSHNLLKALDESDAGLPLLLWDERLSTQGAENAMLEADLSRANRAGRRDKIAASLILQTFLDYSTTIS